MQEVVKINIPQGTAQYCRVFNKFFDLFNTKQPSLSSKGAKQEVLPERLPYGSVLEEQDSILKQTIAFVDLMRKGDGSSKNKPALLPFQHGVIGNCIALPLLLQDLREEFPGSNLCLHTYNLNQDCLESLFSVIRALGGTYTAPSPLEFKYRMRKILTMTKPDVMLQQTTNVLADKDTVLMPTSDTEEDHTSTESTLPERYVLSAQVNIIILAT